MRENVLLATNIEDSALVTGSLAVEVCCGALQHPKGVGAPAAQNDVAASSSTSQQDAVLPLGPVPHMIRSAASALGFATILYMNIRDKQGGLYLPELAIPWLISGCSLQEIYMGVTTFAGPVGQCACHV